MKLDIDAWEWFKLGGKEGLFEIKKGNDSQQKNR